MHIVFFALRGLAHALVVYLIATCQVLGMQPAFTCGVMLLIVGACGTVWDTIAIAGPAQCIAAHSKNTCPKKLSREELYETYHAKFFFCIAYMYYIVALILAATAFVMGKIEHWTTLSAVTAFVTLSLYSPSLSLMFGSYTAGKLHWLAWASYAGGVCVLLLGDIGASSTNVSNHFTDALPMAVFAGLCGSQFHVYQKISSHGRLQASEIRSLSAKTLLVAGFAAFCFSLRTEDFGRAAFEWNALCVHRWVVLVTAAFIASVSRWIPSANVGSSLALQRSTALHVALIAMLSACVHSCLPKWWHLAGIAILSCAATVPAHEEQKLQDSYSHYPTSQLSHRSVRMCKRQYAGE